MMGDTKGEIGVDPTLNEVLSHCNTEIAAVEAQVEGMIRTSGDFF